MNLVKHQIVNILLLFVVSSSFGMTTDSLDLKVIRILADSMQTNLEKLKTIEAIFAEAGEYRQHRKITVLS